jgi:hypothetical protein
MADAYETHYGFIDSEYKPDIPYLLTIEQIQSGGWILILFFLIYLWYGMILVKLKYLNPVLEDICEILDEKKSYITKSLFYLLYQNIDIVAILFYGKPSQKFLTENLGSTIGSVDATIYTLFGSEFSNYFLVFSIINISVRNRKHMNSWMLGRDAIMVITIYTFVWCWVWLDGESWTTTCLFVGWFVF